MLATVIVTTPVAAAALNFDKFDSGTTLDWTAVEHVRVGGAGDDGGFIRTAYPGYPGTSHHDARWMGNFASVGGNQVIVDLMAPLSSEPLQISITILGPISTIDTWHSTQTHAVPNDGKWRTYHFLLTADNFVDATWYPGLWTFEQALQSVILFGFHDTRGQVFNSTRTLCLDNIRLLNVPEPNGLEISIPFTTACVGFMGRRRSNVCYSEAFVLN
jgi:hypothetical protein